MRGSAPQGVILQHAPARTQRCDFENMAMPTPVSEINLIQTFSDTRVIGMTINHENMEDADVDTAIATFEGELGIPVTDALSRPEVRLVDMIVSAFPELARPASARIQ